MAVYFYYGNEEYFIEEAINKLKKGLDKNYLDMSFKTFDNPNFTDLISILRTQPMMFGKMLVIIKCDSLLKKSWEDKELKQVEEALENNTDNVDIVFTVDFPRNEKAKLDNRKKIVKLLLKQNSQEFASIPAYKPELEVWIKKHSKDLDFEPNAIKALIAQVGNNLRQLDKEIEKLKLFLHPQKRVTSKNVQELCIANEDLFNLTDYLVAEEKDKAVLEYRKLLESKYCLEILAALQTVIKKWIILKAKSSKHSTFELAQMVGQHEYLVKLNLQKLKNTNLKYLVKLKQNLTEAEYKIKAGQSLYPESEVENAFFK